MIQKILLIGLGGGIGAVLRHSAITILHRFYKNPLPIGTIAVNLTGCFLIGLLWGFSEKFSFPLNARIFIFVGILGGFTTFSSYGIETFNLLRGQDYLLAFTNFALSNFFGIALVFLGFYLSRASLN